MRTAYLFDVDGTLTPSRRGMNGEFRIWFCEFMSNNDVFLVTGSDYVKTVEQLGTIITENVQRVYGCSGNDTWQHGQNIYSSEWKLPDLARSFLTNCLYESKFKLRTGLHIEERPGMINFSVVGRNASMDERQQYVEYDEVNHERNKIAQAFNTMFPELTATAGGETGLDIYPTGKDKAQIIGDFSEYDSLVFFGDRCDELGNDYTLSRAITGLSEQGNSVHNVSGWEDTWKILQKT
jgi:phosphomannomutase|tara:strand:- start:948 stop:1658 length:711 start_codon:yes stop_codon:yes gene_type:complete